MTRTLDFVPLLPPLALAGALLLAAVFAAATLWSRRRGAGWRAAALALLALALAGPEIRRELRRPLPGVVVLVTDRSSSQALVGREAETEATRRTLAERIAALPGIELREAFFDDRDGVDTDGTRLFESLGRTLADVPPDRVSGVVMITDGQVHDVPATAAAPGFTAPVHVLLTGRADEIDRRIEIVRAPRFGLVGKPQTIAFRVVDAGVAPSGRPVTVTVKRDGEEVRTLQVMPGREETIEVDVPHAGDVVVELEAAALPGELTALDNRAALTIEGIREHLRVLLVSGEPHPGERTWRNLLKSDAAVDLVHFTILRPPEKQDGTPITELSLIAFPTRELFQEKIREFDLIVFDRYRRKAILPAIYLDNIARWVRDGGAVLVASGPDLGGPASLYETPLADVLPGRPSDGIVEEPFRPRVSTLGARHPVTRDLPGGAADPPEWSRWFRLSGVNAAGDGATVLTGAGERPLLVLARKGKGRVGLMTSDQVWLWARGFEGGGPHGPLLRRLAHWLMKEPDLEEERLRLSRQGRDLVVERQTLAEKADPVTVETPTGAERRLDLALARPGVWRAVLPATEPGLWRAGDGTRTALLAVGPPNPREFADVLSTDRLLAPIVSATGGTLHRLAGAEPPRLLLRDPGTAMTGPGWLGLAASRASVLEGLDRLPLFEGLIALAALLGLFATAWWREGR
ncbi:MAG: hypothetical protein OEL76_11405 [Siculibacillus sp.]|nr:hypothetical protein [Siculibacillus sp.]